MNKAVIYARVSTEDQAIKGISLDAQVNRCLDYVIYNKFQLIDTLIDAGISGKSTERPGLQRILNLIDKKKIHHVVTLKLDRLSRRTIDSLLLMEIFNNKGVQLHLVAENGSVNSLNPDDEFLLTLKAGIAQLERKKISERTRFALDRKRQLGQRISLHPPYGYRFLDDTVVPELTEQNILKKIQKLHSRGLSIRSIIKNLNQHELFNRYGRSFSIASVQRILRNYTTPG